MVRAPSASAVPRSLEVCAPGGVRHSRHECHRSRGRSDSRTGPSYFPNVGARKGTVYWLGFFVDFADPDDFVAAHMHTGTNYAPQPVHPFPDNEERCPGFLRGQNFEQLVGPGRIGAVVEGQRDRWAVAAAVIVISHPHRELFVRISHRSCGRVTFKSPATLQET